MKKSKDYTLLAIAIPFFMAMLLNLPACYNGGVNQEPAVNNCPYEGAECPNVQEYLRDYQIEVYFDTVWVYDANRLVGKYINTRWDSQLDTIIINDNL